jgi:GNAT superfamily N-acetyltransferase
VAASAEGQGIGKRLLEEGESWARRLDFDWLSISVFAANRRALTLYEAVGFKRDIMRLVKPL